MIFFCPVHNRIHNVFPYHFSFWSSVVSASGTVGIASVCICSWEIARYDFVKTECVCIVYMIVYDIHDNINTIVMQRLYHLLHLVHSYISIIWICGIGAFRNIVVYRIIAPVKLFCIQLCFIYRTIIINRKQVKMGNTQIFQIINACTHTIFCCCSFFCKCKIFTLICLWYTGAVIDWEISDMQFVNDRIRIFHVFIRAYIFIPALRICGIQIDNHCTLTVHTGCFCIRVTGFFCFSACSNRISIIYIFQISRYLYWPNTFFAFGHGITSIRNCTFFFIRTGGIKIQFYRFSSRGPYLKCGSLFRPDCT